MCWGMCWYYDWWLHVWFLSILTSTFLPKVIGSNHPFGGISILLLRIKKIMQSRPESYCEIWTMAETQYMLQCIHKHLGNATGRICSDLCTQIDHPWTCGLVYGMTWLQAGINGSPSLEMMKNAKKNKPYTTILRYHILTKRLVHNYKWQAFPLTINRNQIFLFCLDSL
jgi:hypothetical protein